MRLSAKKEGRALLQNEFTVNIAITGLVTYLKIPDDGMSKLVSDNKNKTATHTLKYSKRYLCSK